MATKFKPHGYQKTGIEHILNNPEAGLFLDMGLGKTVITLTAIEYLIYKDAAIRSALVIAPKKVVENTWTDEAAKWQHTKKLKLVRIAGMEKQRKAALKVKADIYLISRDNIAWLVGQFGGSALPYDMLVIDELSSFKNAKSQRFKALKGCLPSFAWRVGLTGTPSPNGLQDLWSQLYLLDRGERLYRTEGAYKAEFFHQYEHQVKIRNKKCADEIHRRIGDICIAMKAEDYLTLPERVDNVIPIRLSDRCREQYREFEIEKILELVDDIGGETTVTVKHAAALCNKLLQFGNGAIYDEERNVVHIHDEKLDRLEEIVETANGQPVLIAWAYQHDRDRILARLKKYKPRQMKGRQDLLDWNAGKVQVMLAHPASAGHGLNLQAGGSIIIWFGLTWSLELYQQFNARLHRQGQEQGVIVHHLVALGTMDERVMRALREKDEGQSSLMQAVRAEIKKYIKK